MLNLAVPNGERCNIHVIEGSRADESERLVIRRDAPGHRERVVARRLCDERCLARIELDRIDGRSITA